MKYTLNEKDQEPFVRSKNNIIIEANKEFIKLIGYSTSELIGKSLTEISCMLRINSQIHLENIENHYKCYIFTKLYEPREVTISCDVLECQNDKIYFFKEKQNSRIKDKCIFMEHLYADKKIGFAIYSVPNLILLKANQIYFDNMDFPFDKKENSIGREKEEIIIGFKGSKEEKIFLDIIKTGESYQLPKNKYDNFKEEIRYMGKSVIPIFVDGKVKYIIDTAEEATERVLNRKLVREQTEHQKEQQLEAIIEKMSDGVLIVYKDGRVLIINDMAKKIVYQPDTEISLRDIYKTTMCYDLEGNITPIEELLLNVALKGEIVKNKRMLLKQPDREIFVEVSASPFFNKDSDVTMAIICIHDITDLVRKEKIIKQQQQEFDAIIENMSDALAFFDKDGNYTRFNKSARELYFDPVENINKIGDLSRTADLFDMDKQLILKENLPSYRVMRGEKLLGVRICKKTKDTVTYIDTNGTPIYDNEGNFIAGILSYRDVTEMVKYQVDLLAKTQYDFLNRMIDNLDLPVLRLSYSDFKIIDINQKAYNFVKGLNQEIKSISFVKGQNYDEIIPDCDKTNLLKQIQNILDRKETSYLKYEKMAVSGKEVFVNMLYQPVVGLNGGVTEIVVIVIDVTEEIKAKHHSEKNLKMQEELLVNIAHELKTPLNVISSSSQLLELYFKNDSFIDNKDKIMKSIYSTKHNCYRLTKLISNIVDLSKIESGFFQLNLSNENIVDIIEGIIQSVSEYVHNKGMSIIFDTNIEEKIIACDPNKIERIILNLISNAIKFSEPGDEIYVEILNKDDIVEISVKDSGIGIDKKYFNDIFERFKQVDKSFTRNAEGSGIGLCLVKSIVELHGGKISVESKLGEGSEFKIELPSKIIEKIEDVNGYKMLNNNVEMINVEFSDIYS